MDWPLPSDIARSAAARLFGIHKSLSSSMMKVFNVHRNFNMNQDHERIGNGKCKKYLYAFSENPARQGLSIIKQAKLIDSYLFSQLARQNGHGGQQLTCT